MAKYKVREVYTPYDPENDRSRRTFYFESESTDPYELAVAARAACHTQPVSEATMTKIRVAVEADQLEDQGIDEFEFIVFGNNGEWVLTVTRVD